MDVTEKVIEPAEDIDDSQEMGEFLNFMEHLRKMNFKMNPNNANYAYVVMKLKLQFNE